MIQRMEHTHEFDLSCDLKARNELEIVATGTVNGTAYTAKTWADCDGEAWARSFDAGDLEWELSPLRHDLTKSDYAEIVDELNEAAQEMAEEFFREASIRYTPA